VWAVLNGWPNVETSIVHLSFKGVLPDPPLMCILTEHSQRMDCDCNRRYLLLFTMGTSLHGGQT